MPIFKDRMFVLGSFPLGENDHLFRLFGRELGKIKATAKNSQKPRNQWMGLLNSMNLIDTVLFKKTDATLYRFNEVDVVKRYSNIMTDLNTTALAFGVLELPDKFISDNQTDIQLFRMIEKMMEIVNKENHLEALFKLLIYEYFFLITSGVGIQIDFCTQCNIPRYNRSAYLSVARGGVVCRKCKSDDEKIHLLSKSTLDILSEVKNNFLGINYSDPLKRKFIKEIKPVIEEWFVYYFDRQPIALDMLSEDRLH